jgi:3-oxoacyl-[acyl-carrier protein] reductase
MKLKNCTAVVTGASKGIGLAIAEALADEGARLIVNARTSEALEGAAGKLRGKGVEVRAVAGDVGDERTVGRIVEAASGRLDLLVNNAGIGLKGPVEEMTTEDFDRVVRTNLRGPFLLTRAAIPIMRGQEGGTIVNVASLAGKNAVPNRAAYAMTKWGLIGFGRSVMGEIRKHNIRILTVAPGSTMTEFGHGSEKLSEAPRLVQPSDVAAVVVQALKLPDRATVSEFEIRPTNPSW